MIIVRIWGGIGNQLFEYVFGCYLKEKYNCDVYYDLNTFGKVDKTRSFELDIIADNLQIVETNRYFFSKYRGIKNRLLRFCFMLRNKYINENNFEESKVVNTNSKIYLEGYWQTAFYASKLSKPLDYYFTPKQPIPFELKEYYEAIDSDNNSVSLHVRRGDYFMPHNIATYGVCTKAYYSKAIEYLNSELNSIKLYIFTDDELWVKENISTSVESVMVKSFTNLNDYWYIYLMSKCRHNIISNSSFSWWGAFLNNNPQKIVVSPDKWTLKSEETIALDNWIKIATHE